MWSADPVLTMIVAGPGARPCLPLHGLEIALFATHHHRTSDRSRSPTPLSWELKPAAITTSTTTRFWKGKGLGVVREAVGRERERSAIEPVARYAPAVPLAHPCAPKESDALLWTPGGGLPPPPVLGAGAARTTSNRCACPFLPPPARLTHPHPLALCACDCLTHFPARHRSP